MPPSPSLRRSPSMEPHGDSHKRGRSLESGISFKEKDDDLALFNEMETREAENFLLQPTNDFEDIFSSKVKSFPDFKLGINIPARGESSDLLNVDGDKNDYEWLLTPPDTPLFPSLDDEPTPSDVLHNGRARSRPISISRSSTMERSQRSSRGSPSPQRLSPSRRSGSGTFRGRPSSAPHPSPVPLRPSTPSRKLSPPPAKPSTPPPRSSTPTSRRSSADPGVKAGLRGTSPVRTSRGNSTSPKIKAWQSNIPGFSLEAPPNLRTSLADRPASYVRGSSPASRMSKDSSSLRGRQSISPSASRSIGSSHSQDRDRLSSHSKGSVASSGDDDADSLLSVPMNVSDRPMSRRGVAGSPSSRPSTFSKKPTKTFSPSSAPKRSFDYAMRQMDRKSPQNMFRPLLSSVPSSTFYAGKASAAHRSMISRNSSVTTSSNASSDQATSGAHDTEGSDLYQDDMASDCAQTHFPEIQDELFAFDKMDVTMEDDRAEAQLGEPDKNRPFVSHPGDSVESSFQVCAVPVGASSEAINVQDDLVETGSHENTLHCSRCGCWYHAGELTESEQNICPKCKQKGEYLTSGASLIGIDATENASAPLLNTFEESNVLEPIHTFPQLHNPVGIAEPINISQIAPHEENRREAQAQGHGTLHVQSCSDNFLTASVGEESIQMLSKQQIIEEQRTVHSASDAANDSPQFHKCSDRSDPNIDVAEGTGISVLLLKRSSSVKGPLVHGRTISSSAISFDDLSYARDFTSSMRSSTGHGSMSTSSSIDMASGRHGEMFVQRQLSGGRRSDTSSKPQSTINSCSGTSMQVCQSFGASTSSQEENFDGSVSNMRHIIAGETPRSTPDKVLAPENTEMLDAVPSVARAALSEGADDGICMSSREKDDSLTVIPMEDTELANSQASMGMDEGNVLHEIDEDLQKRVQSVPNVEDSALLESFVAEENKMPDNKVDQMDVMVDPLQCSLSTVYVTEIDNSHPSSPRSQIETVSIEESEDASAVMCPANDVKDSVHSDGIVEESTVTVEDQVGRRTRSLMLEEATDTILFCSSIVHDLAYKAASIAIEKEKENLEPLEGSRPTVTIPEKRNSNRREPPATTTGRATKPRKARKRHAETEAKPPLANNDEKTNEPVVRNVGLPNSGDSMKPPKLESKCNCTIM